jgi:uncharacterized protein YjiS (DUF1127 family)
MDIPFIESQALRVRRDKRALSLKDVLSTLTRQISGWISLRLAARRSIAELMAMDDRTLRDIGLRREEVEDIWRYGKLPEA